MQELLDLAKLAAIKAGSEILQFYSHNDFDDEILKSKSTLPKSIKNQSLKIEIKDDKSPVTSADLAANRAIFDTLKFSNIPICSEEQILSTQSDTFWLIDPLDGTMDFLQGNGEFCICIALIKQNRPVIGVIYLPVTSEIFFATSQSQTQKELYKDGEFIREDLTTHKQNPNSVISGKRGKNIMANKIAHKLNLQIQGLSSAIKFCRIAQGISGIYLRYSPSYIWDNAAGDMIVSKSGAKMIDLASKSEPIYTTANLQNREFIVISKQNLDKESEILKAIYGDFGI